MVSLMFTSSSSHSCATNPISKLHLFGHEWGKSWNMCTSYALKVLSYVLHFVFIPNSIQPLKFHISHIFHPPELERMSASMSTSTSSGVGARHVSGGQMKFLEALVKKHGGDVKAMAADLKLNPEQRTIGQIRRALKSSSLLTPQLDFISID